MTDNTLLGKNHVTSTNEQSSVENPSVSTNLIHIISDGNQKFNDVVYKSVRAQQEQQDFANENVESEDSLAGSVGSSPTGSEGLKQNGTSLYPENTNTETNLISQNSTPSDKSTTQFSLEDRVQQLEEQIRVLTMANQELSSHVAYLLSKNASQAEPQLDLNKVTEIIETQFEVNRRVRTVAIINTTSGGGRQYGEALIKRFSTLLGSDNVYNINVGPAEILKQVFSEKRGELRIIVAGGDGSVNWVLNTIDEQKDMMITDGIQELPKIAIFPLGCGNDLSRVLKWGGSYSPITDSITLYLKRVSEAHIQKLDRWRVTFKSKNKTFIHLMSNYFSIGVDAQVALNFHSLRQENPQLCLNRTANKLWYFTYGIGEMLKSTSSLRHCIDVIVDGRVISKDRIKTQSLIWVNIPSYSGGTNLWHPTVVQNDQFMKAQEFDDGLLELVGINSIHHMAQIKAGLSAANCVSQGRKWVVNFKPTDKKSSIAAQVDGEPFILDEETEITIEEHSQVEVLIGETPTLFQIITHVQKR